MNGADEAEFLELLVANSRIGEWVERIRARGNPSRQKQALLLLKEAVESRSAYAEEARQAGVVPLLTRLLGLTGPPEDPVLAEDEEVLDACSAIIAACSGPMATAGKVSTYTYDGAVVRIREGALGDGLGAKVWMVAHMLCLELASNRGLIARQRVLELGSGCGVCGLAAAALGAAHVVLTDVEGPVLRNLRSCMHLNNRDDTAQKGACGAGGAVGRGDEGGAEVGGMDCGGSPPGSSNACQQPQPRHQHVDDRGQQQPPQGRVGDGGVLPTDAELFDEAEEVEDFDDLMGDMMAVDGGARNTAGATAAGAGPSRKGPCQQQQQRHRRQDERGERAWETGNTSVRLLDWAESQRLLDGAEGAAAEDAAAEGVEGQRADGGGAGEDLPPRVPAGERFPVIIGSEVMYEQVHAELVAAVVKHRLAPGGCAVLHCAVRETKVFDHFARECRRRGLRYRRRHVEPAAAFGPGGGGGAPGSAGCPFEGILGRAEEYEGGFLLMALDHEESPCADWYRDDWETVAC